MNQNCTTPQERVQVEKNELTIKLNALEVMLSKSQPHFISDAQWKLLHEQQKHMKAYKQVLEERLALFSLALT